MKRSSLALFIATSFLVAMQASAAAEDPDVRKVREELEQEVQKMVQVPGGSVKVVWTGFDYKGYEVDEGQFDLDGKTLPMDPSDIPRQADRTLFEGKLESGTHHFHIMLLVHLSSLSLLGGYRVTQFRVRADVPFPAARGLSVPVRVGLHIDPQASDPEKRMVLTTDIKPVMLTKIDDSLPPPLVPPATKVAVAEIGPPPLVTPPSAGELAEDLDAGPVHPRVDGGASAHPSKVAPRGSVTSKPEVDAGPASVDAGPEVVDAGLEIVDAGPQVVDAGPPMVATLPPPTRAAVVVEANDSSGLKRIAAGIAGLLLLVVGVVVLRRGSAPRR